MSFNWILPGFALVLTSAVLNSDSSLFLSSDSQFRQVVHPVFNFPHSLMGGRDSSLDSVSQFSPNENLVKFQLPGNIILIADSLLHHILSK